MHEMCKGSRAKALKSEDKKNFHLIAFACRCVFVCVCLGDCNMHVKTISMPLANLFKFFNLKIEKRIEPESITLGMPVNQLPQMTTAELYHRQFQH